MPTYIMLSNLTDEGAKALKANPKRLQEVNKEIEKFGAKVTAQYAVLGPYDFVSIVECPDNETIARVSVELASRGSIRLLTLAATPVANFLRSLKAEGK
ncbi:MAG: GYD domain-containing protein [Gemmatimonadales bacterium]